MSFVYNDKQLDFIIKQYWLMSAWGINVIYRLDL